MWFNDLTELGRIKLEHSSDSHLLYLMIMGGYVYDYGPIFGRYSGSNTFLQ